MFLLGPHDRFRGINCDALNIHEIPLARVERCDAQGATNCSFAGIDIPEKARGHGGDFQRVWRVVIHVHDRFFSEQARLPLVVACCQGVGSSRDTGEDGSHQKKR